MSGDTMVSALPVGTFTAVPAATSVPLISKVRPVSTGSMMAWVLWFEVAFTLTRVVSYCTSMLSVDEFTVMVLR